MLHAEGLDEHIAERLNIWTRQPDLSAWQRIVERFKKPARGAVKIGVVGKYVHLKDSYKSLHEALVHGGLAQRLPGRPRVHRLRADRARRAPRCALGVSTRILVPGGFGDRGHRGKDRGDPLRAREQDPVLRDLPRHAARGRRVRAHVCGLEGANSTEFDSDTPHPVIDLMPEQRGIVDKGGTMRLGAYPCTLAAGHARGRGLRQRPRSASATATATSSPTITASGSRPRASCSPARRPTSSLVEMVELPEHPVLRRLPVPPRVQEPPDRAAPALLRASSAPRSSVRRCAPKGPSLRHPPNRAALRSTERIWPGLPGARSPCPVEPPS